jgi:hypothetical protein
MMFLYPKDITEKFLNGLPKKYHERVESVEHDSEGYLVFLNFGWHQADDDISTVIGSTMVEA